jgi:hypothetical protein
LEAVSLSLLCVELVRFGPGTAAAAAGALEAAVVLPSLLPLCVNAVKGGTCAVAAAASHLAAIGVL